MLVRLTPFSKIRVHCLPFREITGQKPPLAPCAQQVQHGTKDLVQIYRRGLGATAHTLQQGKNFCKLLWTDVAGVSLSHDNILRFEDKIINRFLPISAIFTCQQSQPMNSPSLLIHLVFKLLGYSISVSYSSV